jgi:hypothetical protein
MSQVIENPEAVLREAARELQALELERGAIPSQIAEAARAGDAEKLRALRHRELDIGVDIWAARMKHQRAVIRQREAEGEQLRASLDEYEKGALQTAIQRWQEAAAAFQKATETANGAKMEAAIRRQAVDSNGDQLRQARRDLDALIAEAGRSGAAGPIAA